MIFKPYKYTVLENGGIAAEGIKAVEVVTSDQLNDSISDFLTDSEINSLLQSYVTTSEFQSSVSEKASGCDFQDDNDFIISKDHQEIKIENAPNTSIRKPRYITKNPNDDFVFMANHENPGYITSYDVSCKNDPVFLDSISVVNGPNSLAIEGDFLFAALNTGKLSVINVSDPENLIKVSENNFGGQMFDIDISPSNDLVAMAGAAGNGLVLIDVSDPTNTITSNTVAFPAGGVRFSKNEDYVFITNYSAAELRVYDIIGASPSLVDSISIGSFPVQVEINEDIIYVGEFSSNQIHLVDVSDPTNISFIRTLTITRTTSNQGGVSNDENYLYIFSGLTGGSLDVFDNSDPSDPQFLFQYNFESNPSINTPYIENEVAYIPKFTGNEFMVFKLPTFFNKKTTISSIEVTKLLSLDTKNPPSSSSDSGFNGEVRIGEDSGSFYIYIYLDGGWKRTNLSSW